MQVLVGVNSGPSPPTGDDHKGKGRAATVEDCCVSENLEVEPCSTDSNENAVNQSIGSCIHEDGPESQDKCKDPAVDTEDDNEQAGPSEWNTAIADSETDKEDKKPLSVLAQSMLHSQSWAKDSTYVRICETMGVHINDNVISERTRCNAIVAIAKITTARAKSNMLKLPLRNFFRVHPDVRLAPDSDGPAYVVMLTFIFAGDNSLNRIVSSNLKAESYNISTQGEKWLEKTFNGAAEDLSWRLEEALKEYQDDPSNLEFWRLSTAGHQGCSFYEMLTTAYRIVIEEAIFNTDLSIILGFADVLCNIDNSEKNTNRDGIDVATTRRSCCSCEIEVQPAVTPALASGRPVLMDPTKLTIEECQRVRGLPPDAHQASEPAQPEYKPEIICGLYRARHSSLPGLVNTLGFHIDSSQTNPSSPNLPAQTLQPVWLASNNNLAATTSYRTAYTLYPMSSNFSQMAQPAFPQADPAEDARGKPTTASHHQPAKQVPLSSSSLPDAKTYTIGEYDRLLHEACEKGKAARQAENVFYTMASNFDNNIARQLGLDEPGAEYVLQVLSEKVRSLQAEARQFQENFLRYARRSSSLGMQHDDATDELVVNSALILSSDGDALDLAMQSTIALETELPVEELEVSISDNEQPTLSPENEPSLSDDAGDQLPATTYEITTSPPNKSSTDNQHEICMIGGCKGHTHAVLSLEQAQNMAKLLGTDLATLTRDFLEGRPQSCRSDLHLEGCTDWSNCECGGVTPDARPCALPQFTLSPVFVANDSPFPMHTSSRYNGMASSKTPRDNEMHYAENPRPNALRRRLYFAEEDQLICLSPIKDNRVIIRFSDAVDDAYKALFPLSKAIWRKTQFLDDAQEMYRTLGKTRSEYQMLVALEMKYQVKIKALYNVRASGDEQD